MKKYRENDAELTQMKPSEVYEIFGSKDIEIDEVSYDEDYKVYFLINNAYNLAIIENRTDMIIRPDGDLADKLALKVAVVKVPVIDLSNYEAKVSDKYITFKIVYNIGGQII